jgi:hypothetical protein
MLVGDTTYTCMYENAAHPVYLSDNSCWVGDMETDPQALKLGVRK